MNEFLQSLRQNWVVFIFIGSIVMSWTMFSARLSSAEEKITKLEEIASGINQLNLDVAVIKNDVSYIKAKVQ